VNGSPSAPATHLAGHPAAGAPGRRLLAAWTAFLLIAWVLSSEVFNTWMLAGAARDLFTPPWPDAAAALRRAMAGAATAAFLALAACGAGRALLGIAGLRGPAGDPGLSFAAGIPVLGLAFQGAGLAGLAWPGFFAAACAGPAILGLPLLRALGGSPMRGSGPLRVVALAAAVAVGIAACAPEVAWDAMVYHLRVPSLYLLAHRIHPVPEIFPSFFPFTGEMMAMAGLSLGGEPAARLLHAAAWLASGAMVGRLAAMRGGAPAGPLATAMFLSLPAGMVIAGRAYVEYYVILPLTASLVLLLGGGARAGMGRLAAAGWLAGAAVGAKYMGGFAGLVAGMVAAARAGVTPRTALAFVLPALAAGAAWPFRNFLWTANPVFPVLFGGPRWTPLDMAGWRADARAFGPDPAALLAAPWTLVGRAASDGLLSPLPFIAAASVVFVRDRAVRVLWLAALALLLSWWATSPLPRYLLPALSLACAAAACEFTRPGNGHRLARAALVPVLFLSVLCGIKATQSGTAPYDAALGKLDAGAYRDRYFRPAGFVAVMDRLDAVVPPRGRVYFLGHLFTYGLERRVWFEFLYLRPPLYWLLDGADSAARVAVRARQAGLTHIVYHPLGCRAIFGGRGELMAWTPAKLTAWKGFWTSRVRPRERIADWVICEVESRPPGAGAPRAPAAPASRTFPRPRGPVPGTEGLAR